MCKSNPLFQYFLKGIQAFLLLISLSLVVEKTEAHPMPNSVVLLDVGTKGINAELQLPLTELQLALGKTLLPDPETKVKLYDTEIRKYLLKHLKIISEGNKEWKTEVMQMEVQPAEQSASGPYQELTAHLKIIAPEGANVRKFTLIYDVIIHQVVTHSALVSVRQDWDASVTAEQPVEVGSISLDIVNNRVLPLEVNLKEGSVWKGFTGMIRLGMQHIAEGTDHLLFLLVLLLPVPLIAYQGRWGTSRTLKESLWHIFKVVTAFTAGHSVTLILGALNLFKFPSQPIEILIAISILISAIHALRPLFPGRENLITGLFGLIHGMAFAGTLTNLHLDTGRMALSILGFNLGIEFMQLFVIAITIPWLILLSRYKLYSAIRATGAILGFIAAVAWLTERVSGAGNPITTFVATNSHHAWWLVLVLAIVTVFTFIIHRSGSAKSKETSL